MQNKQLDKRQLYDTYLTNCSRCSLIIKANPTFSEIDMLPKLVTKSKDFQLKYNDD